MKKDMAFLLKKYGAKVGATDDFQADVLEVFETLKRKQMKLTEEQKQKLCDYLIESLNSVTLTSIQDEEGFGLHLIDYLSIGDTVEGGKNEVVDIVDQVAYDMDNWEL